MGSTGARSSKPGLELGNGTKEYTIEGAKSFRGKLPKESGMYDVSDKNVTITTSSSSDKNIIFQFTLDDSGQYMSISAYNPRTKARAAISVPASKPSVTNLQKNGNDSQKSKAERMLSMMSESGAVSDTVLPGVLAQLRGRRK